MDPATHPFREHPHRTTALLSVPVFFSLIAEPIAGLVDTAFVKELGEAPAAALGVGTVLLSSVFWIFNFLGIGTQTEVARLLGAGERARARQIASLAIALAVGFGTLVALGVAVAAGPLAELLGASAEAHDAAALYVRIRVVGAPAVLLMTTGFGALRGLQDMRSPLWIAVFANALNVLLDWWLIFGGGPVPALGIAGAAWATVIAQWAAAGLALYLVGQRLGWTRRFHLKDAHLLLVVGADLFLRTGLLTLFILTSTQTATSISDGAGAAHNAIRNVWMFTALSLDAYAATAQSLVGFFRGSGRPRLMRRVASVSCQQSLLVSVVLLIAMLATTDLVADALVPLSAHSVFAAAWWYAALFQPLNAIAFATDGIHWGTADFRYLRNAMIFASGAGIAGLLLIDVDRDGALTTVWIVTGGWILLRAALGFVRIWPGSGPWARDATTS